MAGPFEFKERISVPRPPRETQKPRPPTVFANTLKTVRPSGPGLPPKGFIKGTTSLSEWYIYWALLKVKGRPGDTSWGFQIGANGGRDKGGAIIDFVIWDQEPRLALRVQTERYHIATTNRVHQFDEASKRMLERLGYKVIDLYEEHFIKDKRGVAAILLVREALKGHQRPSPLTWRTSTARPF